MEDWDVNEWQGRRKDQVEKSYKSIYFAAGMLIISIITNVVYLLIKYEKYFRDITRRKKQNIGDARICNQESIFK